MLTPEEQAALERVRNPPEDYTAEQQNLDYLACVVIALREHPADDAEQAGYAKHSGLN